MTEAIRTERTHGLREHLNASQRSSLLQVRHMPGYDVLLDLMEKACIEQETRLINVEVDQAETIVAEHRMAKAFWQVFTSLQKKVETEIAIQLGLDDETAARRSEADNYDPAQELLRP